MVFWTVYKLWYIFSPEPETWFRIFWCIIWCHVTIDDEHPCWLTITTPKSRCSKVLPESLTIMFISSWPTDGNPLVWFHWIYLYWIICPHRIVTKSKESSPLCIWNLSIKCLFCLCFVCIYTILNLVEPLFWRNKVINLEEFLLFFIQSRIFRKSQLRMCI